MKVANFMLCVPNYKRYNSTLDSTFWDLHSYIIFLVRQTCRQRHSFRTLLGGRERVQAMGQRERHSPEEREEVNFAIAKEALGNPTSCSSDGIVPEIL